MADGTAFLRPCINAQAITPLDATTYNPPLRALYVGGAGNVAITTLQGDVVTITAPPIGTVIDWVAISKVMTATTATLLVGFW